jgi:hypothetical protein
MNAQVLRLGEGTAESDVRRVPVRSKVAVSVIGCGQMGSALARALAGKSTRLFLTSRTSRSAAQLARELPGAVAGPLEWAVSNGDVVILATPFEATCEEIAPRVRSLVKDKAIIDVSNPGFHTAQGGEPATPSAAERIAELMPSAHVVKALNCVAAKWLGELSGGEERLTIPLAGDDMWAKACVADLVERIGFEAVDAGPLSTSRWVEALSWLLLRIEHAADAREAVGLHLMRVPLAEAGVVPGGAS